MPKRGSRTRMRATSAANSLGVRHLRAAELALGIEPAQAYRPGVISAIRHFGLIQIAIIATICTRGCALLLAWLLPQTTIRFVSVAAVLLGSGTERGRWWRGYLVWLPGAVVAMAVPRTYAHSTVAPSEYPP
jgi:hypothetical protein